MTLAPEQPTKLAKPSTVVPDTLSNGARALIALFIAVPLVAVAVAIPVAWGGWLSLTDVSLALVSYLIGGLGITIGFHRYFTHKSFKSNRALKITLAIAGSSAIEGPVVRWVADHRKHHAFSDADGDPHSPWRYGTGPKNVAKGLFYSHIGWLFDEQQTPHEKWAPDLLKDPDLRVISRMFFPIAALTLIIPTVLGGLITHSWQGALTAFFWAGLVRIALLHHVTWSINSVCHVWGKRPFITRDKSGNVAWLSILSLGESWHNLHHAEPTSARHGVLRFQPDISARVISWLEAAGWATDVKWPKPERIEAKLVKTELVTTESPQ
jgi:stearoyl-CoA desaturase (delta-9 desaturase)